MTFFVDTPRLPAIDLSLFDAGDPWRDHVAAQIDWAASEFGFFYLLGHGIDASLTDSLLALNGRFEQIPEELGARDSVEDLTNALTGLSHKLMTSIGRGLRLGDHYFVDRLTGHAQTSFRAFSDPPSAVARSPSLEQADDGLLALQSQDEVGGLQVKHRDAWLDVPPVPGSIVCNVGETLEHLTAGRYKAAAHRVVNRSPRTRVSLRFFFDSRRGAELRPIAALGRRKVPSSYINMNNDQFSGSRAGGSVRA